MIISLVGFLNTWNLVIYFLCHFVIFVGVLYTAIHNRELTEWVVTPMWYLGLMSAFVCSTIIVQWTLGPENPISFWTLGQLGSIGSDVILASICAVYFFKTIKTDLAHRKNRHK